MAFHMEFFGGLIGLWMLVWIVYGIILICIPFILYAIMSNTKRSADLLAQILLLQIKVSKKADSDATLLLNKQPLAPKVADESYNFSTQKWEPKL